MTGGWDHFDAAPGLGVHAWAASRAGAFARVAEGMFALVMAPADVVTMETREARAQGDSAESLLVNWLNECFYVHEIEGFAVARVEVDTCTDHLVHGVLHGEPLDAARHRIATTVKAISHRAADVREEEGAVHVRVVVEA